MARTSPAIVALVIWSRMSNLCPIRSMTSSSVSTGATVFGATSRAPSITVPAANSKSSMPLTLIRTTSGKSGPK